MKKGHIAGDAGHGVGSLELSDAEVHGLAREMQAAMKRGAWEAAELYVAKRGQRLLELIAEREAIVDAWSVGDTAREAQIDELDNAEAFMLRALGFGFLTARIARAEYLAAEERFAELGLDELATDGGKDERAA